MPVALNRDETSLAYNAFAILQTARDEHGRFLPLQIESFGDWKLPGYIYTLLPFIAVFGLQDWVVKLPSALASLGTIVFGFLLVKKWSKDELFASLLALILAITPWSIHFARVAYETNLALFFWVFGLYFFEILIEKMKRKKSALGYSLLVIFCWSLTVFTCAVFGVVFVVSVVVAVVLVLSTIVVLFLL